MAQIRWPERPSPIRFAPPPARPPDLAAIASRVLTVFLPSAPTWFLRSFVVHPFFVHPHLLDPSRSPPPPRNAKMMNGLPNLNALANVKSSQRQSVVGEPLGHMSAPTLIQALAKLGAGVFVTTRGVESRLGEADFWRAFEEPVIIWAHGHAFDDPALDRLLELVQKFPHLRRFRFTSGGVRRSDLWKFYERWPNIPIKGVLD